MQFILKQGEGSYSVCISEALWNLHRRGQSVPKTCFKSQNHNQKLVWHVKISRRIHSGCEDVFVSISEEHFENVQASVFSFCFLLFFKKQGALNFFFFFEGDLEGEPSGVLPAGLLGGAVGGAEGVVSEVSVVDRAFICFSSSSCCFFSSPLSFCTASVVFPSECECSWNKNGKEIVQ